MTGSIGLDLAQIGGVVRDGVAICQDCAARTRLRYPGKSPNSLRAGRLLRSSKSRTAAPAMV